VAGRSSVSLTRPPKRVLRRLDSTSFGGDRNQTACVWGLYLQGARFIFNPRMSETLQPRWLFARRKLALVIVAMPVAMLLSACAGGGLHTGATPALPPTFVATTSDTKSSRVIDLRDGLTKAAAFKAASDMLVARFSVDVSDQRAGFLMTPWQASFIRDGVPDLRYRMRVVIRFVGDDWKQVAVRSEANWQRGTEWDIGYDSKVLDEVATELRTRIGRRQ